MLRRLLFVVLVLSAMLMDSLPIAAQTSDPAITFKGGPRSVTVFGSTGLPGAQAVVFPIGAGEAVELMTVPVEVKGPGRHRSFLVVQFVGHFQLPSIPVTITLDCTINHELNLQFGCGITPATDLDFTNSPKLGPQTIIPATFLIRDLPDGTYQIGIRTEAATTLNEISFGALFPGESSLIVSLYTD